MSQKTRKAAWILWKALEKSNSFEEYQRKVDEAMRDMLKKATQ